MEPYNKMGYPHYIQALEAERRKIQVFSRELPLSLELITQAIEACRRGTTPSECSSGQTSSESPVLEEFIFPIKKRTSSSEYCFDDDDNDEDEQHSHKPKIAKEDKIKNMKNTKNTDNNKGKSDWLRSVQLWNPQSPVKEDVLTKKASVLEVKRNGGAFQPFHREASVTKTPSSPPGGATGNNVRNEKKEEEQSQRKQRRCWSQDLHKRFLMALHQLGGADCATPKQIREMMKVDGLTNDEVKSHLQKFRLHTRRPSHHANNGNSQTGPFVIVGNIIVQPPEYATTAVTTSKSSFDVAAKLAAPPPSGIYAPVAAHPAAVVTHAPVPAPAKIEFKQYSEHSNRSEVADHSNSPTSSSSTHTTSVVVSHRYSI